jgi:hypothetical protein
MKRRHAFHLAAVAACAAGFAACGDSDTDPIVPTFAPVVLEADVNVQIGDTPVGSQPHYVMTTFLRATQGGETATASLDSVVLSYRLNDGPFVVGTALRQAQFFGDLPFVVQAGDRYTLFARLYAHATGKGGRSAVATDDFSAGGMAIDEQ